VLLVLLAVEGITLLSLRAMLSWHIFVGVLVVPVVALKLGSTVYRFYRYYTHRPEYVRAGPPRLLLRLLGPVAILSTLALLGSGLALIAVGPRGGLVLGLHKASFVVWVAALGVHVLGHLGRVPRAVSADLTARDGLGGSRGRLLLVAGAVVIGATAAVAVLPYTTAWLHMAHADH
jgi:arginine exporter protein ArgO